MLLLIAQLQRLHDVRVIYGAADVVNKRRTISMDATEMRSYYNKPLCGTRLYIGPLGPISNNPNVGGFVSRID